MKILVVSPHCDDETLGLGGTIARMSQEGHEVVVAVLTGHGEEAHPLWPKSNWEVVREEARQAFSILGVRETKFEEIPAARVAEQPPYQLNQATHRLLSETCPDVLFVPFPFDLHKDHREIFHSCSVAWRPLSDFSREIQAIYCYEVVSETHWNIPYVEPGFLPNVWNDISAHLETKLRALQCFRSQIHPSPSPRSLEAVRALARWRGSQVGVEAAEAFVLVRKLDLWPDT